MNILCNPYKRIDPIPACIDGLIIKLPVASQTVRMRIVDKFGAVYYIASEVNEEGVGVFPFNGLPPFYFNPYAGSFVVTFEDIEGDVIILNQMYGLSEKAMGIMFHVVKTNELNSDYSPEDYGKPDYIPTYHTIDLAAL